jgi:anti-sigma B factor antagonist
MISMTLSIASADLPDATTRLTLTGEIDLGSAKDLRDAIHRAVRDREIRALIVDVDAVTFIDSTGIATLISGRQLADACATSYAVVNPRDLVRRVLEITGVLAYLSNAAAAITGHAVG